MSVAWQGNCFFCYAVRAQNWRHPWCMNVQTNKWNGLGIFDPQCFGIWEHPVDAVHGSGSSRARGDALTRTAKLTCRNKQFSTKLEGP